jgi:hypothetical protein
MQEALISPDFTAIFEVHPGADERLPGAGSDVC